MPTIPRVPMRVAQQTEFLIQDPGPDVSAYKFYAANSIGAAFSAPNYMFTVARLADYRSRTIVSRRWGLESGTLRGLTRAYINIEDFWQPATTLPHDAEQSYFSVAEVSASGIERPPGPIIVVPPPRFYDSPRPSMSVVGTAPSVVGLSTGLPPAGALRFAVPRFSDHIRVRNTSGSLLYLTFDEGQPEMELPANESEVFYNASVSDVFVRGNGATPTFEFRFALTNGI